MIGLPGSVRVCLFDLDVVLTRTATVHAAAWKEIFDGCLRKRRSEHERSSSRLTPPPTTPSTVDGKPRYNGVRSFLAAWGSLRRAVVSSSANTREVLVDAGIEEFFEARIDGEVAEREGLKGKPAPADTFVAGASVLSELLEDR